MHKLLVIEDESNLRYSLEKTLASESLAVLTAGTANEGVKLAQSERPDVVLLDVRLPDKSGLDAFGEIHELDPYLPVILMTAFTTSDVAIEAMRQGAFEYLTKPLDLKHLRFVIQRALELRQLTDNRNKTEPTDQYPVSPDSMIGNSPIMQDVFKSIGRVAATNVNVLVLGESGTGKELVAQAIHNFSDRRDKPFVAVNCAAIPEALLESELFGHEKGAFTGADRRRIGKFEQADGGTIFLDEIGDMQGPTQAKVLRLFQDQRFERIGGNTTIQTDARIVSATNQNLDELSKSGQFRSDLYYRLKVFTIELPALRERPGDLNLLVDHFLVLYNAEVGKNVRDISDETREMLQRYIWPGNIRELQGAIKNALVNAVGAILTPECFPKVIHDGVVRTHLRQNPDLNAVDIGHLTRQMLGNKESDIYRKIVYVVDQLVLNEVLNAVDNNQVDASRRLGISRNTLRAKLDAMQTGSKREEKNGNAKPEQA